MRVMIPYHSTLDTPTIKYYDYKQSVRYGCFAINVAYDPILHLCTM